MWWGPIFAPEQLDHVRIYRCAEIFRQGQPSSFKRVSEWTVSVESVEADGLARFVRAALDNGRQEIAGGF
jgi:hypothetical protein